MKFPAHIRYIEGLRKEQSVEEHCRVCAEYASAAAMKGLKSIAYLTGLIHDMGKNTNAFHEYIEKAAAGESVKRGSVNHTFTAVNFVMERWYTDNSSDLIQKLTCELIACAAGSHHGLFDVFDSNGRDNLIHRLEKKEEISYKQAKDSFIADCVGYEKLDELFLSAKNEIRVIFGQLKKFASTEEEMFFYISLLHRMLLSLVIEGDRRDTAEFMNDEPVRYEKELASPALWKELLGKVETRLSKLPKVSKLDTIRSEISDKCKEASSLPGGIYRLSVPTGGGKTLASLRYALAAAAAHKKRRIFFVIPLLSVLEQNAAVIRDWLAAEDIILEHHSNLVQEQNETEELTGNELLIESWDAPVVITTLVQLLNTLFMGKTSSIRRMNALADSIVIIDEVQSVPKKMLTLFNLALNFLSAVCNTSFVLCSATQPCLEKADHPIIYSKHCDLVAFDSDIWDVFQRTEILDKRKPGGYTAQDLADFAHECQKEYGNVLIICNTKSQAKQVFNELNNEDSIQRFHLSTSMCMTHRIDTLKKINNCLDLKEPVICVSTQLVEAGVDFSFGCVIRISAGLDNIVQAAGRCNRNSEYSKLRPVFIVNFHGENLSRLKEIKAAQTAAEYVLLLYERQPEKSNNNLTSNEAISAYYRKLYNEMPKKAQDFFIDKAEMSIYTMLSDNKAHKERDKKNILRTLPQAFKTAGSTFSVFDNNTFDIIAPYNEGEELVTELSSGRALSSLSYRKNLLDGAKQYTISVYDYEIEKLRENGGLTEMYDGEIYALKSGFYSKETGLDIASVANSSGYFI